MSGDPSLKWGCSKCKGEEWEHGDDKRNMRGCDGPPVGNIGFSFAPSLQRCPWSQIDNETWTFVQWWADWTTFSVLPWSGSDLMLQPAFVMEVMEICETQKKEHEKKEHDKQQAEIERARKKNRNAR